MQRLLIVILAAVDAGISAAVSLAVLLTPLTLLWTFAFGVAADWGSLWPTTSVLWGLGHAAPVDIVLPDAVLRDTGIAPDAAAFTLSVPPLVFLVFTVVFAARSGRRAAHAGSWITGVLSGTITFTAIAAVVALTGRIDAVSIPGMLGTVAPGIAYLCGALVGAVVTAWIGGDGGAVDALRQRVDGWGEWAVVPGDALRGAAAALTAVLGAAAVAVAVAAVLRGGEVVSLFESLRVDVLGATVVSLGQLAYLPTLLCWASAWLAGPGFALGAGTAVSPAGTQLGVAPGIPVLGLLPETSSPWALIVILVPVAAGALAGWILRSRSVSAGAEGALAVRTVTAAAVAVLSGLGGALLAALSSGSMGPGRLSQVGPDPWTTAAAVAVEVFVGAAILLALPRHRSEVTLSPRID